MNERIVQAWNETVGPDDIVWIVGDLCMGKMDESLPIAGQLQGRKRLVPGNHDRCHPEFGGKKGASYWDDRYREVAGIEVIKSVESRIHVGHHRGVKVCHFPYTGDHTGEKDRYTHLRPKDTGEWLIHGHVHDAWIQNGRMINVGLDAWGGEILPIEKIEAMLDQAEPQWTDRTPWPERYPHD